MFFLSDPEVRRGGQSRGGSCSQGRGDRNGTHGNRTERGLLDEKIEKQSELRISNSAQEPVIDRYITSNDRSGNHGNRTKRGLLDEKIEKQLESWISNSAQESVIDR